MGVPTIELADLLTEPPDVESQMARKSVEEGIALLDRSAGLAHRDDDLCGRKRIENRLEGDLDFPCLEVVDLWAGLPHVGPEIAGYRDLRVERVLSELCLGWLGRPGIGRGSPGGRADGGELVAAAW